MKRKIKDLSERERITTLDALYTAAGSLKGRAAMKLFLRDLLTESERIMLGRRILIARLLLLGTSRRDIGRRLGVGLDTVHRVEGWLRDQFPGYENAVRGLEKELDHRKKWRSPAEPGSFTALKRKYPLYFLFFNIADEIAAARRRRKIKPLRSR